MRRRTTPELNTDRLLSFVMNSDQAINTFVSELAKEYVNQVDLPADGRVDGALLFVDVSGFSKLANSFSALGAEGAEKLTGIINTYFEQLVSALMAHGCDIVAFAGDAMFGLIRDKDLVAAAHRAAHCGLLLTERLSDYTVHQQYQLSMRISIGAGQLARVAVGDDREKQILLVGPTLAQIRAADKAARPGETVLSTEVIQLLGDKVTVDSGSGARRLRTVVETPTVEPLAVRECPNASAQTGKPTAPPFDLRSFVPVPVLSRLDVGQSDWIAELRHCSIVFVRFDSIDTNSLDCAGTLQSASEQTQRIVRKFDGTVIHFLADDKGTIAILGFGIPPNSAESLADRALGAAQQLVREFSEQQVRCSAGIATGDVFCGPLGSTQRRCFTVLGDVVNLAARLMQSSLGDVLCDLQTKSECPSRMLDRVPNHWIKGTEKPVQVFRAKTASGAPPLVGREHELERLEEFAQATSASSVMVIKGEAGIGKSELAARFVKIAASKGKIAVEGSASKVETNTPFFTMRNMISRLYRLQSNGDPAWRREDAVMELVGKLPDEVRRLVPLLNAIFDTHFPEDELVKQLTGERRVENLHRLMRFMVQHSIDNHRIHIIVLDDVQWMDEASANLARSLMESLHGVSWLLVSREVDDKAHASLRAMLTAPDAKVIPLKPLDREATLKVIQQNLGEFALDEQLAEHLWTRCGGNPFFARELTRYLIDAQLLTVRARICSLEQTQIDQLNIPNSVKDVVAGRLAQLSQPVQLTAKVASVIGQHFEFNEIDAVYPLPENKPQLRTHVTTLCDNNIVEALRKQLNPAYAVQATSATQEELGVPSNAASEFCFRHYITQKVAYTQLPLAQRRQLHKAIATWLMNQADDGRKQASTAYHFENAESYAEAAQAYARAGEFALKQGASFDSIGFLKKALSCRQRALSGKNNEITSGSEKPESDLQRNSWEGYQRRLLGEAYMQAGQVEASRLELEAALKLFGHGSPKEAWKDGVTLVRLLAEQFIKRFIGRRDTENILSDEPKIGDVAHCVALANQRLAQIHYFKNDLVVGTARALRALRIAQSIDDSPGLARSYADMCIVMTLLRMVKMADHYAIEAERIARRVKHLPSLAYVLNVTNMHRLAHARWDEVLKLGHESIQIGLQLQCYKDRAESLAVPAMLHCFRGELSQGQEWFDQVRKVAEQGKNGLHSAWAHCGQGEILVRTGRYAEAEAELRESILLLTESSSNTEMLRARGLLSFALWQLHRRDEARDLAMETAENWKSSPTASALEGFYGVTAVLLSSVVSEPTNEQVQITFKKAMKDFLSYSKVFPVGGPRYHLVLGKWCASQGKLKQAERAWKLGSRLADRLVMPAEAELIRTATCDN